MQTWILLTIINALIIGFFECFRKKALEKNNTYEVAAFIYLIDFIIAAIFIRDAFYIELKYILMLLLKATILVVAWLGALYALKHLSMGIYGMISTCRIIITVVLSALILGEIVTPRIFLGMIIIIIGIILVNKVVNDKKKVSTFKVFFALVLSCLCNSISAILDKYLLTDITYTQMLYWCYLFMTIICFIIILIKGEKIDVKGILKNKWLTFAAVSIVIADSLLLKANADVNSSAAVISLIKQLVVVETIVLGKFIFKEKDILKKLAYSLLIIFGVTLIII